MQSSSAFRGNVDWHNVTYSRATLCVSGGGGKEGRRGLIKTFTPRSFRFINMCGDENVELFNGEVGRCWAGV